MVIREDLKARIEVEKAEWRTAEHIDAGVRGVRSAAMLASIPLMAFSTPVTAAAMLGGKMLIGSAASHFTGLNAQTEKTEYETALAALNNADAHLIALSEHDAIKAPNLPSELTKKEGQTVA